MVLGFIIGGFSEIKCHFVAFEDFCAPQRTCIVSYESRRCYFWTFIHITIFHNENWANESVDGGVVGDVVDCVVDDVVDCVVDGVVNVSHSQ